MKHSNSAPAPKAAIRRSRGFTLIELMIVVAIIAILSAIAVPSYNRYVLKSHRGEARTALLDLAARQERFYSTNNVYTDRMTDLGYTAMPVRLPTNGPTRYEITVALTPAGFLARAVAVGPQLQDLCREYSVDNFGTQQVVTSDGQPNSSRDCL